MLRTFEAYKKFTGSYIKKRLYRRPNNLKNCDMANKAMVAQKAMDYHLLSRGWIGP